MTAREPTAQELSNAWNEFDRIYWGNPSRNLRLALDAAIRITLVTAQSRPAPTTDEFAWVIEKGSGSEPWYYAPTAPGEWTKDHLRACRFARKEDAEAVQFRHVTHGHLPEYDTRVCEHGWMGTGVSASQSYVALVHGDQVLIRATYIANTRERAPPLSDRAWVRYDGDDHLSECPIAAIEKRGLPEGDAWEYWNGRAMAAEAELHEMKRTARSAQDEWRPIETAPKDGTYVLVGWRRNPAVNRLHWARHGEWTNEEGVAYTTPTHWQPLPPPPAAPAEK